MGPNLSLEKPPSGSGTTLQRVGNLIKRLATDTKVLAEDQVDLARAEVTASLKSAALSAAGMILTGMVIAISIGFLAVAVVVALEPLIGNLALRLVLVAAVYLTGCYGLIQYFVKRFKDKLTAELPETIDEAKRTVDAVQEELRHA